MTTPPRPTATPLPDFDPAQVVDLDLREDLRAGREPLKRILAAADALVPGSVLHLRTPFQPTPLFRVLADLGFAFHTEPFADDDWSSWFWRGAVANEPRTVEEARVPVPANAWDLRHLVAPEPLNRLLQRVATAVDPFDVLLPAFAEIIPALLAETGWAAELIGPVERGVLVRIRRVRSEG